MSEAPKHIALSRNEKGRDFIVGDIHGETDQLVRALKRVSFDTSVDRLISVGDLVDRGPDSLGALELLAEDWFYAVVGNHEAMLMSDDPGLQDVHYRSGGAWAFEAALADREAAEEKVRTLPYAITLEGPEGQIVGICHAEWPERDWARVSEAVERDKIREQMIWGRKRVRSGRPQKDRTADLLVHGHTPIPEPLRLGCALFIDTGATYDGYLTLISVTDALNP